MSTEAFLEKLGLAPGIDMNVVERLFTARLQNIIANASQSYDDAVVSEAENEIRGLYKGLFAYTLEWQKDTIKAELQRDDVKDHPDAAEIKKRARKAQAALQKFMYNAAIAHLHVVRHVMLISSEVEALGNADITKAKESTRSVADLGTTFNRNRKQKERLYETLERLKDAYIIVAPLEDELQEYERKIRAIYKKDKADKFVRRMKSTVRTEEFTRTKKFIKEVTAPKKRFGFGDNKSKLQAKKDLLRICNAILELAEANADTLRNPDYKLYLSRQEVESEYRYLVKKLFSIKEFTMKNYAIYMQHQLELLKGLKMQLDNLAELSDITNLHTRLAADPCYIMSDLRTVRNFESGVLDKVDKMIRLESSTAADIQERADKMVEDLRLYQRDFVEMSQLDIPETLG